MGHKSEMSIRHSDGDVKWVVGDAIPEVREVESTNEAYVQNHQHIDDIQNHEN